MTANGRTRSHRRPQVIISNGHFKFILAPLAAEVARQQMLALFLTGAYPGPRLRRLFAKRRLRAGGLQRFLAREEPGLPAELVRAKSFSELLVQAGVLVRRLTRRTDWGQRWEMAGMRQYGRSAVADVEGTAASIYHYRSGYGHASVAAARRRGMITVCDHSLPNPEVMDYLIAHDGAWPASTADVERTPWSNLMLPDLRAADYLVVNSDFVKESFVRYGWDAGRIFVQYTGVDDDFVGALPADSKRSTSKPRILFAGELSRRKGTHILATAIRELAGVEADIELIGAVHEDAAEVVAALRRDLRVGWSNLLPRHELAARMAAADVFVFPSLAEGSARVVFMALAAGCYIVTTPNAGSIVSDGVHGAVVPPGDARALAEAIRMALARPAERARVGHANAQLIRQRYAQSSYGRGITTFYQSLAATSPA